MTEKITVRVGRIISGTANSLIDAVENVAPEMLMEQTLREIDGVIDEVRAELGRVLASNHLASARLDEESRRHGALAEQIKVAVAQNRDDLAAAAIAQQLDIEAQHAVLERTTAECMERERELEDTIVALKGRRQELTRELACYTAERRRDPAGLQTANSLADTVGKVARAEAVVDRVLERVVGLPGRRPAPNPVRATRLAELEALDRKIRIEERLAVLKKPTDRR